MPAGLWDGQNLCIHGQGYLAVRLQSGMEWQAAMEEERLRFSEAGLIERPALA